MRRGLRMSKVVNNLKAKAALGRLYAGKIRARLFGDYKKIISRVKQVNLHKQESKNFTDLPQKLFVACSYRINSPLRQEIFSQAVKQTFKNLGHSGLAVRAADASMPEYIVGNHEIFKTVPGLNLEFSADSNRFQNAHYRMHQESSLPYFCMVYDDQAIIGLTKKFLRAACDFLEDFKGLVDLILIESPQSYELDKKNKKIIYNLKNLEFLAKDEKPLAVVNYGGYNFAILFNFHFGFFFNTIVGRSEDYARRLKWYMDNVKNQNAQYIELAGMRRKGPIYNFLAVPMEVCMFNIDCAHSELSIRGQERSPEELFNALKNNYEFLEKTQ